MVMYIFNPENDLALANFSPYYTPPASIVKLGLDLTLLPLWYSPDGSVVISQSEVDNEFIENVKCKFGLKNPIIPLGDILFHQQQDITPWGWSPFLKNKITNLGVSHELLPSSSYLNIIQEYSNRKNAITLLSELKDKYSYFYGSSFFFTQIDNLLTYLSMDNDDKALKMPLSGSGRGLIWILNGITDKQTDWARRVIKTQGGVVAEPKLNKVQDFAMEFSINNGLVTFEGYSLFETAASGAYMGNVLMSDSKIEDHLAEYVSIDILNQLRQSLLEKLSDYFPLYNGFLGVDMMICSTDSGFRLQPCVEINMRMNMGMVSHMFYERFVNNQSKGHYRVDYFKKSGEALLYHKKMSADFPLVIDNHKIRLGYMSLTPVNENTNYVAWVLIR